MEIRFIEKILGTQDYKKIEKPSDIDASRVRMFLMDGVKILGAESALKIDKDIIKIMENENIALDAVDFYPAFYTENVRGETTSFNQGREIRDYSKNAADLIFSSSVEKNGKRISASQAALNMEKIMLRGHCLGGYIITEINIALYEKMHKLGYSEEEIQNIIPKASALKSSSAEDSERSTVKFTTITYFNMSDKMATESIKGPIKQQMQKLSGIRDKSEGLQWKLIKKPEENATFVVTNGLDNPSEEHVYKFIENRKSDGLSAFDFNEAMDRVEKGHYFNLALSPLNEKSKFMQSLSEGVSKSFGSLIRDVVDRDNKREQVKSAMISNSIVGNGKT